MPFASALSEHPLPTHAAGEVVGAVLEAIGPEPDLACLFVTVPHAGALDDIVATVRGLVRPHTMIGALTASLIGGDREVEEQPAVVLWAARLPGGPRAVSPVRLTVEATAAGVAVTGLPAVAAAGATLLLLADPFTFPTDEFLTGLHEQLPVPVPVVGGMVAAATRPGANRLLLDGAVHPDGAVGVLLGPEVSVETVVSQGCRPVGDPVAVTRAEGRIVHELAGAPALQHLEALAATLAPAERALLQRGLHLGIVVDEQQERFGRGDFLIRNVLGADRDAGAIAVGDEVPLGAVVQFQARDAAAADEELRTLLAGRRADGALVFTCNGRGTNLFGLPDHDAGTVAELLDHPAAAGMFCAGEIGPVGGRSFLHGFTASVALFRDR